MILQTDVAVIGGGISGLSAAFRLQRLAPDAHLALIESSSRLGGVILTERSNGFVVEGGPESFLTSKPRGVGLCGELGLLKRLEGTNEQLRRTYVMRAGELAPIPEGLTGLVPSRLEPLLNSPIFSEEGKRRLAQETRVPPMPPDGDESLAAFVERRFGREIYDRLIEPLMAGIYAGDGELLSLAATFPQLRELELEHGSVIAGISARSQPPEAPRRPAFLTPRTGMQEIVSALAAALNDATIRLKSTVMSIRRASIGYRIAGAAGEMVDAAAVIVATPAPASAELLAGLDADIAVLLAGIPCASTATVSLAYRDNEIPRPLDGYGYIIPRVENRPVLACTWVSSKYPRRAPAGFGLIRVFVGRYGQEQVMSWSDAELAAIARDEMRDVLGVTAEPVLQRIFRWPAAMPQYTLGHRDRVARIRAALPAHPGLYMAGTAFDGVGIPDCIRLGEAAAESAAAHLAKSKSKTPDPVKSGAV